MFNFPSTRKQEGDKVRADIQSSLPESNPYNVNNYLWAISTALGNRIFDVYRNLQELLDIWFISTTYDEYLEKRASTYGITRNPATNSSGYINITGTVGESLDIDSSIKDSNGSIYNTQTAVTISNQVITLSSLTSSGTTATGTSPDNHNLATGQTVTISDVTESEYNGDFEIVVTSNTTFTYSFEGSSTSPATGTILASGNFATVEVESEDYGDDYNLESGEQLTLLTPTLGIDNTAYVLFDEIGGGADIETDEELRDRLLYRIQNPVANFNVSAITNEARELSFVNRVWVQEITPTVGDVTIYFDKKGDDIIPSGSELLEVKTQILTIKPATSSSDDVYVVAPTLITQDFVFASISPDTTAMRTAVQAELENFFKTQVSLGEDVPQEMYTGAISQAKDITTGVQITEFALTSPTGDITVADGEIPNVGTITYT